MHSEYRKLSDYILIYVRLFGSEVHVSQLHLQHSHTGVVRRGAWHASRLFYFFSSCVKTRFMQHRDVARPEIECCLFIYLLQRVPANDNAVSPSIPESACQIPG